MGLFGTSGIRGVVGQDITPQLCRDIARVLASLLPPESPVCIATDTRTSGDSLKQAVVSGFLSCSVDVTDLGVLPTPALAWLTRELGFATGIMVTASHNPPEFNGLKLFNANSLGYSVQQERQIEEVYSRGSYGAGAGQGNAYTDYSARQKYLDCLAHRFGNGGGSHRIKVAVDAGNGAASGLASQLLRRLGFNVVPVNDTPDGHFPGRNPEPEEDTLQGTIALLRQEQADLAICFDGDADRVVFCDKEGFLGFNEMIAFISRTRLDNGGTRKVATTVETGRLLDLAISDAAGEVVRGKVGDVNVSYLMNHTGAAIGVEQVGVYIFPEMGPYPDSFYAALLLLSQIQHPSEIRQFFSNLPRLYFDKLKLPCPNQRKQEVMSRIESKACQFGAKDVNNLDGLRFEFDDSWILIRPSGTEPAIRVIAEASSREQLSHLLATGHKAAAEALSTGDSH